MKMIVVEHIMRDIFSQIPVINLNIDEAQKPYFGWGNKKELNKHLALKNQDADDEIYPLIWLLPSKDVYTENGHLLNKDCSIIIATRETRVDMLNVQRWQKSFEYVLNPLANFVIEGLKTSTVSKIIEDEFEVERFSDYSDNEEGGNEKESASIDLWDAVKVTASVEFTNNCLKTITWQTKQ